MGTYLSVIRTLLVVLLSVGLWSCGSTSGEGTDEDSNIVSEIDEATSDMSEEEGGDEESLSEGGEEGADEEFASEYEDEEKGDEAAAAEGEEEGGDEVAEGEEEGGEKAEGEEEFADEDFQDEDFQEEGGEGGEEVAEGDEEGFEDFDEEGGDEAAGEEGADREVAQEGGEPTLEALDGSSEEAMNEPPAKAGGETAEAGAEGGDYPDAQVEEPGASGEVAAADGDGEAPAQGWVPVKKIKDVPFEKNGRLLNTVYIFRTDTDLASVSQKIFGEDRSAQLLEDNPHLARGAKTGDKLYYNSPSRPTDSSTMKVAYEDVGQVAQEYVTKVGDNIRSFSESLLGFPDAWKEVWATNASVESKDEVSEGLSLRYWKDDLGSLNTKMAETAAPTPELDATAAAAAKDFGAAGGAGTLPPPPPVPGGSDFESGLQDMASANQAPPPPPPPLPGGDVAGAVPPPVEGTPTVPGLAADKHAGGGPAGGLGALGGDSSMMIYVALGLLAAVALFIKKKKSARAPSVFEATQV